MGRTSESQITAFAGEEFTSITFKPDLAKFKMSILDKDTVALMTRRAYDIAGASKGIRVILNGKKLPVSLPPNMILLSSWSLSGINFMINRLCQVLTKYLNLNKKNHYN